jgi:hypothetical protein
VVPMAAARVADWAKCLAGKKIGGSAQTGREGGSRRRIVAASRDARPGLLTVRMQATDFSVWSSSSFSGAAFSCLAGRLPNWVAPHSSVSSSRRRSKTTFFDKCSTLKSRAAHLLGSLFSAKLF